MVGLGVLFHRGQWNGSSDRSLGVGRLRSRCVWTRPNSRFVSFLFPPTSFHVSSSCQASATRTTSASCPSPSTTAPSASWTPTTRVRARFADPSHPGEVGGGGGRADATVLQVSSPTRPTTRAGTAPALRPTLAASTWGSFWRRSGPSSQRDSGESETPAGGILGGVGASKRAVLPHQGPEGFKRLRGDLPEEVKRLRVCRR